MKSTSTTPKMYGKRSGRETAHNSRAASQSNTRSNTMDTGEKKKRILHDFATYKEWKYTNTCAFIYVYLCIKYYTNINIYGRKTCVKQENESLSEEERKKEEKPMYSYTFFNINIDWQRFGWLWCINEEVQSNRRTRETKWVRGQFKDIEKHGLSWRLFFDIDVRSPNGRRRSNNFEWIEDHSLNLLI